MGRAAAFGASADAHGSPPLDTVSRMHLHLVLVCVSKCRAPRKDLALTLMLHHSGIGVEVSIRPMVFAGYGA